MRTSLAVTFHLCALSLSAQVNLVENSGFESHLHCPSDVMNGNLMSYCLIDWNTPTQGSPDYYNTCAIGNGYNTQETNPYGPQYPLGGDGYVGVYAFSKYQSDLREYIQIELSQPIMSGIKYLVSFNVSIADSVIYCVSSMGAHLSVNAVGDGSMWNLTSIVPDIQNPTSNLLCDPLIWQQVADTFISRIGGGERFLTIGNFETDLNSDTVKYQPEWEGSHRYAY